MKLAAKNVIRLAVVLMLAAAALVVWRQSRGSSEDARLPATTLESVPRITLATAPIYFQGDPKWADERIGGSKEPLRAVGCTVCCLSMALAEHGVVLNPLELNRKLKEADGYTELGWVKWAFVEQVAANRVRIEISNKPTQATINDALARGAPVLVKVLLRPAVQHWVLVVGRDGHDYLIKDPLGDGKSLGRLADLSSDILAVRIVRRR
jgi:hypothetical protein